MATTHLANNNTTQSVRHKNLHKTNKNAHNTTERDTETRDGLGYGWQAWKVGGVCMKGYLGKPAASGGEEQPETLTGDSLTDLRRDSSEGGGEAGRTRQ